MCLYYWDNSPEKDRDLIMLQIIRLTSGGGRTLYSVRRTMIVTETCIDVGRSV